MSGTDQNLVQWSESDFLEHAVIEAFAPSDSDLNLQELIENWDGNGATASTSIVPFVEQRQFILLGSSPSCCNYRDLEPNLILPR
jgi:hypothetical protein